MVAVTFNNIKLGAKVVRGKDWQWSNQDRNSIYGIITMTGKSNHRWCQLNWIDKDGRIINHNVSYRIGEKGAYDLYYYENEEDYNILIQSLDNLETKLLKGEELNGS